MNSGSEEHLSMSEQQRVTFQDDEEEECRVCRGPEEEGRSLYKPCKCSGSIALTHQDCLQSWLEVKGGKGKCDLCSTIFRFAPKYAEDAPEILSRLEVLSGLGRRAASRWVPYALRALLVAFVWLVTLPLSTAYLYQGWMYRPSSIKARFLLKLVPGDVVNGGILTVIIVITFLSLMSLFDFFRLKWARVEHGDGDRIKDEEVMIVIAPVQVGEGADCLHYDDSERPLSEKLDAEKHIIEKMINDSNHSVMDEGQLFRSYDDDVDSDEVEAVKRKKRTEDPTAMDDTDFLDQIRELQDTMERHEEAYSEEIERLREAGDHGQAAGLMERKQEIAEHYNEFHQRLPEKAVAAVRRHRHRLPVRDIGDNDSDGRNELVEGSPDAMEDAQDDSEEDEDEMFQRMMRMQEMDEVESEDEGEENIGAQRNEQNRAERFDPQFVPLDRPFDDEDLMDADLQMPIEQIIGLRGPIVDLFRNFGWLLAFQTIFIAIFTCIPRAIGSFVFNHFVLRFKYISTILHFAFKIVLFLMFDLNSKKGEPMDFAYLVEVMSIANKERDSLLVPHDVANIVFGYISLAMVAFILEGFVRYYKKYEAASSRVGATNVASEGATEGDHNGDDVRQGGIPDRNRRDRFDHLDVRPSELWGTFTEFVFSAIEMSAAASKISFLVCFKMFILPCLLGTWLDLSTLKLFDSHIEDRMSLAGADIVGFFILHWVIGITFMLTVTVSVLQLREVLHPDLLAPVIRPQEPQPDLLINLLEDSGWTHAKRMVPSLGIYAAILFVYVWLPCQLMYAASLQDYIPLFRPHFWYAIYSPLQRPIELMLFHLSVLSILEKHKNKIGEMQHTFLLKVSNWVGITECLLPRNVYAWMLVDEKPLHISKGNNEIDIFWENVVELNKTDACTDDYIEFHLNNLKTNEPRHRSEMIHRPNQFIILSHGDGSSEERKLMPTRIGMFSFRKKIRNNGSCVIEIWRECVNDPIPRPPKGWDYLVDGGSVEQGRWAWGKKEKKSDIELRVAARKHFFPSVPNEDGFKEQWESAQFFSTSLISLSKLFVAAFVSWLAVTVCTSAALFLPLIIGRCILQILGLPTNYVHDPFAFVSGCLVLAPAIQLLINCAREGYAVNAVYRRRFSLPPFRKIVTLVQVFFLWLVVCPLLAGTVYHHCFIKTIPSTIESIDMSSFIYFWPVGLMLTHLWAALCYVGAFKYGFWANIHQIFVDGIAGVAPPENNDNNQRQEIGRRNENNDEETEAKNKNDDTASVNLSNGINRWQGEHGIIGNFAKTLAAILTKSEWDKIDQVVLVDECLVPVARQLLILLFAPIVALIFAFVAAQFSPYLQSTVKVDIFRVYLYRYSTVNVVIMQLAFGFQDALSSWYKAGHEAARDHRYLVGKILLNYRI